MIKTKLVLLFSSLLISTISYADYIPAGKYSLTIQGFTGIVHSNIYIGSSTSYDAQWEGWDAPVNPVGVPCPKVGVTYSYTKSEGIKFSGPNGFSAAGTVADNYSSILIKSSNPAALYKNQKNGCAVMNTDENNGLYNLVTAGAKAPK